MKKGELKNVQNQIISANTQYSKKNYKINYPEIYKKFGKNNLRVSAKIEFWLTC